MGKRKGRAFRVSGGVIVLLALITVLIAIKDSAPLSNVSSQRESNEAGHVVQLSITERVNKLWELAQHSGGESFETKIIMQGSYLINTKDWKQEALKWKESIRVTTPFVAKEERGMEVLRSTFQGANWKREILVFAEQDGRLYFTVHLTGVELNGKDHIVAEGENIHKALQANNFSVLWNSEIRTKSVGTLDSMWGQMQQKMQLLGRVKPLDHYEDNGTRSVSYETDYMGDGIKMKSGVANLQMAVHELPAEGITRLTVGTPLIAGEY
ncbi:YwmB family TATA-box binding protein [Paenibacillus sp. SC116]|uniref:YwmB family TATA-box binding protein n=1 Tax=Paenibacillus sp. SC116 TaxID=2968986 RepID=UPI00215A6E71|nr:YwmB family TATA-box binding protein [Paenibacillus sp. SC116]MCR8846021.1 YwmB family TATA-box binding protein [Paenibacillus sp. SC116]